jgi:hypothetical protein
MLVLAATTTLYYRQRNRGGGEADLKPASPPSPGVAGPEAVAG